MLNSTGQKTLYGLMNILYPVGSYYITESSDLDTVEKMNTYFGGTWERVLNVFLLGAGDKYSLGLIGGEENHTLTESELAAHQGHLYKDGLPVGSPGTPNTNYGYYMPASLLNKWEDNNRGWSDYGNEAYPTAYTKGESQPHNNMPPYRAVYMYKRKSLAI